MKIKTQFNIKYIDNGEGWAAVSGRTESGMIEVT